jgi:hypothetical protein
MARINTVQQADAGLKLKLAYWFMRKGTAKLTDRAPAAGRRHRTDRGLGPPAEAAQRHGKFQQAVRKSHTIDQRLGNLIELKGARRSDASSASTSSGSTPPSGIGSAGFSEGMVCVPPDRPAANSALARIA